MYITKQPDAKMLMNSFRHSKRQVKWQTNMQNIKKLNVATNFQKTAFSTPISLIKGKHFFELIGGRQKAVGWRQKAVGWRQKAVGWRQKAVGWRQKAVGWRQKAVGWRQKLAAKAVGKPTLTILS
jgi:uncharacterized protein YjbJ (UPF0337 family)